MFAIQLSFIYLRSTFVHLGHFRFPFESISIGISINNGSNDYFIIQILISNIQLRSI